MGQIRSVCGKGLARRCVSPFLTSTLHPSCGLLTFNDKSLMIVELATRQCDNMAGIIKYERD